MGHTTEPLRLPRARTRGINGDGPDGTEPKCSFHRPSKSSETEKSEKWKRCEENAIIKIELNSWEQGIQAGIYDLAQKEWSDQYSYFCDRCGTIRLSYLHNKPKHELLSTESQAPFYSKYPSNRKHQRKKCLLGNYKKQNFPVK